MIHPPATRRVGRLSGAAGVVSLPGDDLAHAALRARVVAGVPRDQVDVGVQNALAAGQVQLRLQFNEQATNNNGVADVVRPTPKLIVSFTQ